MPHYLRTVGAQFKYRLSESLASGTDTSRNLRRLAMFWSVHGYGVWNMKGVYDMISAVSQSDECKEVEDVKKAWKDLKKALKALVDS